jgi:hypothetical protein
VPPLTPAPPAPAEPSREVCLVPPNVIRWKGQVKGEPRRWHLLGLVLDRGGRAVSYGDVIALVSGRQRVRDKTIQNNVYALNAALLEVGFPWGVAVQDGHVTRKPEGP